MKIEKIDKEVKIMSTGLANILEEITNLSYDELLTVQEKITQQLRTKGAASNGQANSVPSRRVVVPGAYTPTPEEIEKSLAATFTPEQIAEIGKRDFKKFSLKGKSLSETVIEDREDRL